MAAPPILRPITNHRRISRLPEMVRVSAEGSKFPRKNILAKDLNAPGEPNLTGLVTTEAGEPLPEIVTGFEETPEEEPEQLVTFVPSIRTVSPSDETNIMPRSRIRIESGSERM